MSLLSAVFYVALFLFLYAIAARVARYAKMPPHLRWELYPAAAEKGASEGSYLEQQEWWNKPRHRSRLGELRFQVTEMFLFHRCYVNNRGIWRFTLPFHWGLYLLIGWLLIQFACSGVDFFLGTLGRATAFVDGAALLAGPIGIAGLLLTAYGCAGLVLKRLTDRALRSATSRGDFFGLFLILGIVFCWLLSWGLFDRSFAGATTYFRQLAEFAPLPGVNPFMACGTVLFSVFLAYMPFTYLAHAFAKYFIFHKVVWQDAPMLQGSDTERRIEALLGEPVGWSASHINKGASWSTTVSSPPQ